MPRPSGQHGGQRRAGKPRCSSAADCQLAAVISTVTGTTHSAPIIPIIGGSMSIIAPVHDRACGCLVAVEGSSRAPGVHARYCGLWAAASTSESVHKVRQILAHRPMNRGGAFLAECGEGSHSPPRPAASRWGILWCCRTDFPRRTPEAGCPTTTGAASARSRYVVPRTVVANGVSLLARSAGSTASSSAICSRTRSPPAGRSTVLRRCVPSRQSAPVASRTTASGVPGSAVGIAGAAHPGVANPHVQLTAAPIRAS